MTAAAATAFTGAGRHRHLLILSSAISDADHNNNDYDYDFMPPIIFPLGFHVAPCPTFIPWKRKTNIAFFFIHNNLFYSSLISINIAIDGSDHFVPTNLISDFN